LADNEPRNPARGKGSDRKKTAGEKTFPADQVISFHDEKNLDEEIVEQSVFTQYTLLLSFG